MTKRTGLTIGLLAVCLFGGLPAVAAGEGWLTDFAAAKKAAAEKKLPVFALFTGSDWCPWCVRLEKEVLSTDAFKNYAKDSLVLLFLDFPRRTQLPEAQAKANRELAEQYGVRGDPTALLLDAAGKVLGKTGYRQGGGEAYVANLKELLSKPAKANGE